LQKSTKAASKITALLGCGRKTGWRIVTTPWTCWRRLSIGQVEQQAAQAQAYWQQLVEAKHCQAAIAPTLIGIVLSGTCPEPDQQSIRHHQQSIVITCH
jgi:hypothetical protein